MFRLVLIDSHALLHRAYHALPKLNFKRSGRLVNAVYGFFSMLLKAISELKPDYLITCFDAPAPNFRHQKFVGYQANRPKTEVELEPQIDLARKSLKDAGIPTLMKHGFEADDLIGTIASKSKTKEVITVTGDRDLMQLVNKKVKLFLLTKGIIQGELIGIKGVKKSLGVRPEQVVDYKALAGDQSDNYPGVPGVGPKTAVSLLKQFHNLKQIYGQLKKVDSRIREKLEKGKESAFLSRQLAEIDQNVPVKFSLTGASWDQEKLLRLKSVLKDLGFPSLVKRIETYFDQGKSEEQMRLV